MLFLVLKVGNLYNGIEVERKYAYDYYPLYFGRTR